MQIYPVGKDLKCFCTEADLCTTNGIVTLHSTEFLLKTYFWGNLKISQICQSSNKQVAGTHWISVLGQIKK